MSDENQHAHYAAASTLGGGKANQVNGGSKRGFGRTCAKCGARRVDDQIGLEPTPEAYIENLVAVFSQVWRVLKEDGTLWLNLGDSYASNSKGSRGPSDKQLRNAGSRYEARKFNHGVKEKDLLGIPWMAAFALRADGWYLRSDIIWHKPNPMPESVEDRPTKAHEYIFLLSKSAKYFYDGQAIREKASPHSLARIHQPNFANQKGGPKDYRNGVNPNRSMRQTLENFAKNPGRNKRSVWTVTTKPYKGAHFAVFPPDLIEPCVLAGSRPGDTVLDPFMGSGTTGAISLQYGRNFIGCELNGSYIELARERISQCQPLLMYP